jgi:hypothetical protein
MTLERFNGTTADDLELFTALSLSAWPSSDGVFDVGPDNVPNEPRARHEPARVGSIWMLD